MTTIGVVGYASEGNLELSAGLQRAGLQSELLTPAEALSELGAGDVALVRLDVLPTLDGVEAGLDLVRELDGQGVRVLNRPQALLAAHDKLATAARLYAGGLPHPRSTHLWTVAEVLALSTPVVLKPRFGSWGADVWRCHDAGELRRRAEELLTRRWFARQGVLAQELLSGGHDVRLVVAGRHVVGSAFRLALPGEWRTNVSVGGALIAVAPPSKAVELGVAAAGALGIDLAGVDLLPVADGYVVLEVNGAVDFSSRYGSPGRDVYADIAGALQLPVPEPVLA